MAKAKTAIPEVSEAPPAIAKPEATFTKEQLLASKQFQHRRDVIQAILEEDKRYTIAQAQAKMDAFFGKKVQ